MANLQHVPGAVGDGPRLPLPEHHREVDTACLALLACTYADEPLDLIEQYRCFEREVAAHLAAEEDLILPAYAEHAPADAQALRDDHVEIRAQLLRTAVEVELHTVRADTLTTLVERLRAHAAHEDAAMYPWAQAHLPLRTKQQLFGRVSRSNHALAQLRQRLSERHPHP